MGVARHVILVGLLFAPLLAAQSQPAFQQIPGNLKQISVGADGTVWGVNGDDQIFAWDAQASSWNYIPGSLSQISVGSASSVWGINAAGEAYKWSGSEWFSGGWDPVLTNGPTTAKLIQISAAADGIAWAIDNANHLDYVTPLAALFLNEDGGFPPPGAKRRPVLSRR